MFGKHMAKKALALFALIWFNSVLIGSALFVVWLSVAEAGIGVLIFYLFAIMYSAVFSVYMVIPGWLATLLIGRIIQYRYRYLAMSSMSLVFGAIPFILFKDMWYDFGPMVVISYLLSTQVSVFLSRNRIKEYLIPACKENRII